MDFSDEETRARTFVEPQKGLLWPFQGTRLTPKLMASVGLYFSPDAKYKDKVQCYACGGALCGFGVDDDPAADHRQNYPNCTLQISALSNVSLSCTATEQMQASGPQTPQSEPAIENAESDLPMEWTEYKTPSGRVYYYNRMTKESALERPSVTAAVQPTVASIGTLSALSKAKTYPAVTYMAWSKPASNVNSRCQEFASAAGNDALKFLNMLQSRHQPMHPKQHLSEPCVVVWEDTWTVSGLATKENQFKGTRDREGTMIVDMLAKQLRKKNIKFTDPMFPADVESLFVYPHTAFKNANAAAGPRMDTSTFLAGLDPTTIKWTRACDIFPGQNVQIWNQHGDDKINPDDVKQGSLGNCYFLSAICACATSAGDYLLNDLIIEDYGDIGLYGVKFFLMGKWVTVVVDDYFPTKPSKAGNQYQLLFASPRNDGSSKEKEIWPMVMEKAWAKLHGSYECTDAGDNHDALQYLTGGVIKILQLSKNANPADLSFFKILKDAVGSQLDTFVGCGQAGYKFSGRQKDEECNRVQNPWGQKEWNGRFSDKSDCWTAELKTKLQISQRDEGTFWMEWTDFAAWFGECRIVDPRCYKNYSEDDCARVDCGAGNWVAGKSAGGSKDKCPNTFQYNPRFELVGATTGVLFSLYQPDTRHLAVYDTWPMVQGCCGKISMYFGEKGKSLEEINWIEYDERLMTKSKDVQIESGKIYEVVVAASAAGVEGAFAFSVCGKMVTLTPCPFKEVPPEAATMMAKKEGTQWKGPNDENLSSYGV